MTLVSALSSSVRGLESAQDSISLLANNIANANTEGYIRKKPLQESIVVGGIGQGARITGVSTNIDETLLTSIREQNAKVGESDALNRYMEKATNLFGQPNSGINFSEALDGFFSGYQALSDNPDLPSSKQNALSAAITLQNAVSSTATSLERLRLDADREIQNTVTQINSITGQLHETNINITQFRSGSEAESNVIQTQTDLIDQLSQLIDVSITRNNQGQVSVLERGTGVTILDEARRQLSYTAAGAPETFINQESLAELTVFALDDEGQQTGLTATVIPANVSEDVTNLFSGGAMKGLFDVRDTEIPEILAQLDELAKSIASEVNAAYSSGSSFPPQTTLTGTTDLSTVTNIGFTGDVRIAVVNTDGTPPLSPYGDEQYYRPLTLDLDTLDSGAGAGRPTIQTIVDEINEYYGPPQNRAAIGNLRDIAIASRSTSIDAGGTFTFDIQLDSTAADDATFSVDAITVNNGADGLTSALPADFTVTAGERLRTGSANALTVDFNNGTGGPYVITARVTVVGSDGIANTADITFEVDADSTEGLNQRFHAESVTQVSATGSASFLTAPSAARLAMASYVDVLGNDVDPGEAGFLKIVAVGASGGLVVDDLDSQEVGLPTTANSEITNRGFAHYFGLNNLFVDNYGTKNSAANFAVRSDIASNPNNLVLGGLTLSNQPTDTSQASYSYELGSGNNSVARAVSAVDQQAVNFSSAGPASQINTTLNSYTSNLIGSVSTSGSVRRQNFEVEALGVEGLKTIFQDNVGVNIDNELAEIIEVENNYRAAAQVIGTVRAMFELLSSIF
jgi:flagellar hook-associated protein 1 FlgK